MADNSDNEPESSPAVDAEAASDAPAANPDLTDTSVLEPVEAGDTRVMPPVEDVPEADADVASSDPFTDETEKPDEAEVVVAPEDDLAAGDVAEEPDDAQDDATPSSSRNSLGVWAVVTGALLLFPIALALGHLGLRANKQGEANNRSVALAGVILGYLGMVVALVGTALALFVVWPNVDAQNTDNAAKSDVITLGSELVAAAASGAEPSLWDGVSAWDASDDMLLDASPGVGVAANSVYDWCLVLTYEGGNEPAVAYSSTSGLQDGPTCS